jgi:hypothetical protein
MRRPAPDLKVFRSAFEMILDLGQAPVAISAPPPPVMKLAQVLVDRVGAHGLEACWLAGLAGSGNR